MDMLWILIKFLILILVMTASIRGVLIAGNIRLDSVLPVCVALGVISSLLLLVPWIGWILAGIVLLRALYKITGLPLFPNSLIMTAGIILISGIAKLILF